VGALGVVLTEGAQVDTGCGQHGFHFIVVVGFVSHYQRARWQVEVKVA
jgi:hypothetical protein